MWLQLPNPSPIIQCDHEPRELTPSASACYDVSMHPDDLEKLVIALDAEVRRLNRTVVGLQNELIRAGKYQHDNSDTKVEGIQVLLQRAGEYQGREQKRRRR
jgi:hypothetical protein